MLRGVGVWVMVSQSWDRQIPRGSGSEKEELGKGGQ